MLCLKAEALEEDHRIHPQSLDSNCSDESGDCNGGNSGGFVLPIKWWVFFFFCLCFFFSFCNGKYGMVDAWNGFAGQALLIGICNGKAARFGAGRFWLRTTLLLSWR